GDRGEVLTTGYLGETAMAATKLVLAGILDESPGVRLVWSHLGGGLAMLIDRLDRVYRRAIRLVQSRRAFISGDVFTIPSAPMARRWIAPGRRLVLICSCSAPMNLMSPMGLVMCLRLSATGPGRPQISRLS